MIDSLTPRHEQTPADWPDGWLRSALNRRRVDVPRAREHVARLYAHVGINPPRTWLVSDSPISSLIMSILAMQGPSSLGDDWDLAAARIRRQVQAGPNPDVQGADPGLVEAGRVATAWAKRRNGTIDRIADVITLQCEQHVMGRLVARLLDRVWRQWNRQFWGAGRGPSCDMFRDEILHRIRFQGMSLLAQQLHLTCNSIVAACAFVGQIWWGYCGVVPTELAWLAQRYACMTPHLHAAILQRQPRVLHLNAAGFLHRDGGPAVEYRDGFVVWAMNGVRVPRWLARTPATQLDPRRVLRIRNVDTRREFIRKVGIERVCHATQARPIDRQGNYELLLLDLRDGRRRPFLKMLNPSIGVWHVEGVDPSCRTVAEALTWRNGTSESPVSLT